VAENLYWLGRYLERADNASRLINVNRLLEYERFDQSDPWEAVLDTLGADEPYAEARGADPSLTAERYLVQSHESPFSIRSTIASARGLAMELREHTSREVFEEINRLYLSLTQPGSPTGTANIIQEIRGSVPTVYGLFENTVLHSEGAHWFRFGMMLERADMTSRIVDAKYFINLPSVEDVGRAVDRYQWRTILLSSSALEAYHKSFRGSIRVDRALDLIFFDPDFPRSLVYCVNAMRDEFQHATRQAPADRTLVAAVELAVVQLELGAMTGERVVLEGLHEFIDEFQATLGRIDNALAVELFRAVPAESLAKRHGDSLGMIESLQSN
jgi:uncharacterized alpha-E superfamily protein